MLIGTGEPGVVPRMLCFMSRTTLMGAVRENPSRDPNDPISLLWSSATGGSVRREVGLLSDPEGTNSDLSPAIAFSISITLGKVLETVSVRCGRTELTSVQPTGADLQGNLGRTLQVCGPLKRRNRRG